MDTKTCSGCKENKCVSDFYLQRGKLRSRCKVCVNQVRKIYDKTEQGKFSQKESEKKYRQTEKYWTPNSLYTRAKAAAKQHQKDFLLSKEEYKNLISKPCYYCNDVLKNEKSRGIGLDRIDNSLGYVINNVIRCCGFCNKTRGDRLSVDEMKKVAIFIVTIKTTNTTI